MTHLGADVAAFVDGQLPSDREQSARRHVAECPRCRQLVAEQEHLKRRMAWSRPTDVPEHLAAALAAMAEADARAEEREPGVRRSVATLMAVMGSSAAVLLMAYLVAPANAMEGDPVRPQFDLHAARFMSDTVAQRVSSTAITVSASSREPVFVGPRLSERELDRLVDAGWPCHAVLAGDLKRVDGYLDETDDSLAVRYAGEHVDVVLVEQVGSLDRDAVDGFERESVDGADVWIRHGLPTVATWEAGGLVHTLVTDGSPSRIAAVVADLPTTASRSTVERIEDGLRRMTDWVAAA